MTTRWTIENGRLLVSALLLLIPSLAAAQDATDRILAALDGASEEYAKTAQQIWSYAELGYQERKSSALLQGKLEAAGFQVESGVAGIPTAFVASYGRGGPVIALLAEFDALPGLSQAAVPERQPLVDGGAGHACGHHLYGTASVAAAIAIKEWLASAGRPGTVRLYGTPAEEGGGGKIYMARAGLLDDVDVVLHWHAGDANDASPSSSLANISAKIRFHGVAAHAASAPERGRSALDAVEAMDYMVNLMREHVPQETRIHYIVTRGGNAPNVVPDFAEAYYYVRHPDARTLQDIWARVIEAAKGAALGTGTTMDYEIINGVYSVLPNETLARMMYENLERVGGIEYTPEERAFAEKLAATLGESHAPLESAARVQPFRAGGGSGASTDAGDISWIVPTTGLRTATWVPGTAAHSWQAVAAGGTTIGTRGMMIAAKTLALTGIDLFREPARIADARAEFEHRRGAGFEYRPLIGDRPPPLDYRK